MSKAIIVLGMHRSGTSLLAEVVGRWGAYAGDPDDLVEAAPWNERGHWEYRPLVLFNNILLASLESDWCLPPEEGSEAALQGRASETWYKATASSLISSMEVNGRPWFWKDPRLCILLPFWMQMLDAAYVISLRNPAEIAASLLKRNGLPTSAGLLLWQYYMLSLLVNLETVSNKIFINYDALVGKSRNEFQRLSDFLETQCVAAGHNGSGLQEMIDAAVPELKHNGKAASGHCCELTAEQKNLQTLLESQSFDVPIADALKPCGLYPGWREYLETCYLLRELSASVEW